MKVRTKIALVLAMIAALVVPSNGLAAQTQNPEAPVDDGYEPLTDDEVEKLIEGSTVYWSAMRSSYGFDATPETMAAIARDPQNRSSFEEVGVPFTAEELIEVRTRAEIGHESAAIADDLYARRDFGGMFIDNEAGGVLRVLFTARLSDEEKDSIRSRFSSPKRVQFGIVEHSHRELLAVADAIADTTSRDSLVHSGGLDVPRNAVYVVVDDFGERSQRSSLQSEALKQLSSLSGDVDVIVNFEPRPEDNGCNSRTNCGTGSSDLRGGLRFQDPGGLALCSTGFVFVDSATGADYVSTTGHCDDTVATAITVSSQVSALYRTNTNAMQSSTGAWIGPGSTSNAAGVTIDGNTEADAVMILIPDNKKSNDVFKWGAYKAWFINKQFYGVHGPTIGTKICSAGWRINFKCGDVKDQYAFYTSSSTGVSVRSHIRWENEFPVITTLSGASGAAMIGDQASGYTKRQAVGTHSASSLPCNEYNPSPPHQCIETLLIGFSSKIHYVQSLTGMTILQSDPG